MLTALASPVALAQVYKCADGAGQTVYADTPCGGASKPMRLPQDPTKSTASPTACAQLEDELGRLDAQAGRDAERGRKPNSADTARRQSLGKQYAARCAGITLSKPSK
jgi:hypothetical protein